MKYIFIGPRSVGKSTIGKLLAKKLNIKYFDFDDYVENKLNGIVQHAKKHGVESYRTKEGKILKKFVSELPKNCVFSVGGGTVASQFHEISKRNASFLKNIGKLIYLTPSDNLKESIKIIHKRERKRKGDKDYSETEKLFKLRKPLYEKIYDLKFIIRNKSPEKVVRDVIKKVSAE